MRNHSKTDKEKTKQALRAKASKKQSTYGNHSVVLKKIKEMATSDNTPMDGSDSTTTPATAQECIFLDAGSKKSYIDLTESKVHMEPYPRISVIRTVGTQSPTAAAVKTNEHFELFQEKPVDFSPKHKYKTEFTNNGSKSISLSGQYATVVV